MTQYTIARGRTTRPAAASGFAQVKQVAHGTVTLSDTNATAPATTGPLAGDTYYLAKLPKGAVIVGGSIKGSRVASGTSSGSTCLTMVLGIDGTFTDGAGTSYGTYASGASALGTFAPDYTRVSGVREESGMNSQVGGLLYTTGPLTMTSDGTAVLNIVTSASSFISASTITLELEYYMGTHA